jgi:toxin CcdB
MARYSVYRLRSGTLVVDCQADVLSHLGSRFVVPLLQPDRLPDAITRLNPALDFGRERLLLATHLAVSIPVREIAKELGTLADQDFVISNAIDMLLGGF